MPACGLLIVGCAVKPFIPRDHRRPTLVDAGKWIKETFGPGKRFLTMDRRVEHYADGWTERVPPRVDQIGKWGELVVIYDPYVDRHEPGFEDKLREAYTLVHRVPKGPRGHEVRIYDAK